jgi:hypothetical protein
MLEPLCRRDHPVRVKCRRGTDAYHGDPGIAYQVFVIPIGPDPDVRFDKPARFLFVDVADRHELRLVTRLDGGAMN